ncbi:hypothetical protein WS68_09050 [Burkholderia sp. TSV86]|nr:hypothetical protein WS68_09050 [Burkholderia sp. TSV86]
MSGRIGHSLGHRLSAAFALERRGGKLITGSLRHRVENACTKAAKNHPGALKRSRRFDGTSHARNTADDVPHAMNQAVSNLSRRAGASISEDTGFAG